MIVRVVSSEMKYDDGTSSVENRVPLALTEGAIDHLETGTVELAGLLCTGSSGVPIDVTVGFI